MSPPIPGITSLPSSIISRIISSTSSACGWVAALTQTMPADLGVLEGGPQRERPAHAQPGDDDRARRARRGAGTPPRPRRPSRPIRCRACPRPPCRGPAAVAARRADRRPAAASAIARIDDGLPVNPCSANRPVVGGSHVGERLGTLDDRCGRHGTVLPVPGWGSDERHRYGSSGLPGSSHQSSGTVTDSQSGSG